MPFISKILEFSSLSIVGLDKNTGKTESLNYILKRLPLNEKRVAITSIGIDGEGVDQVTKTHKPDIYLRGGVYFTTSEAHYRERKLTAEIVDVSEESGALGRFITGKVLCGGKVIISGPSSGVGLKRWIYEMKRLGVELTIIDGALSKLSSASPAISDSLILTTGAAYSANINTLVQKTKYVKDLIDIELASIDIIEHFKGIESGVWGVSEEGNIIDFNISTSLSITNLNRDLTAGNSVIYVAGALTDSFIKMLMSWPRYKSIVLVIRDFTKIFVTELNYRNFIKRGGEIRVLQRSNLLAICVNPVAPNGFVLDSKTLINRLEEVIQLPVYDVVNGKYDF